MNNGDRELLEAAAKAAGMPHRWIPVLSQMLHVIDAGRSETWNPLTDDGDALRLAVKLRMDIAHFDSSVRADVSGYDDCHEANGADPYAATRRCIVRAAAAIGSKA